MKTFLIASLMLAAGVAHAQVTTTSGQTQQAGATSAAEIQPGAVAINSYGADKIRTSQQAPSVAFGSSFSPDSCASGAGGSVGTFPVGLGISIPWSPNYCIALRTFERLQQGAAMEKRSTQYVDDNGLTQTVPMADALRDASYELLAEISPTVRGILSRRGVIHGQAAVQYDKSGTVGVQPASTRID